MAGVDGPRRVGDTTQLATRPVGTLFRAVPQDIAGDRGGLAGGVHAWSEDDPDFVGAVTVLDEAGAQLATTDWPAPTQMDGTSRDCRIVGIRARPRGTNPGERGRWQHL